MNLFRRALAMAGLLMLATAGPAAAQSVARVAPDSPIRSGAIELSVFAGWLQSNPLTSQSALLTPDTTGNPSPTLPLFSVALTQQAAPAFGIRFAYDLTPVFAVEAAVTYSRPDVTATISGDPQATNVPGFTFARMHQVFGDVSLLVHLWRLRFAGGRAIPFVAGGGGYLAQIYRGTAESVNGQVYNVGGGLKLFPRAAGRLRRLGFRADAREYFRTRGPDGVSTRRQNFSLTGSVLFVF